MNKTPASIVALPPSHIDGFEVLQVGSMDLSTDGKLMLGDPFRDFAKRGNPFIQLPVGHWPVMATISKQDGQSKIEAISLVFDPGLLDLRRRWQARIVERGGSIELPAGILTPSLHDSDEATEWECLTGHGAIVSKHNFESGMPPAMPDMGWFEMLFQSGKAGSWFDQADRAQEDGSGIATISLPLNERPLFLFPCHGRMRAWMEVAKVPGDGPEAEGELEAIDREVIFRINPLVALHIQATHQE